MRLHASASGAELEAYALDVSSVSQVMALESQSSEEEASGVQQRPPPHQVIASSGELRDGELAPDALILPTPPRFFDGEQFDSYEAVREAVREYESSLQVKLYINGKHTQICGAPLRCPTA